MTRRLSSISILAVLALSTQCFPGLFSATSANVKSVKDESGVRSRHIVSSDEGKVSAIVELESDPVAIRQRRAERVPLRRVDFGSSSAQAYEAQIESEHAQFKSRAALVSPGMEVRTELRKLVNAISVEVSPGELPAVAALPGVKRVELVKEFHAMLSASVPLINAPVVWNRLGGVGAAGQGVKIAIIDTGIDITNPLFSDVGFSMHAGYPKTDPGSEGLVNNKVIAARSFLRTGSNATDEHG